MKVRKLVGRWGILFGVLLIGLFLAGCQSGPDGGQLGPDGGFVALPGYGSSAAGSAATTPVAAPSAQTDPSDVLAAGDAVTITFSDLPYQVPPINDRIKSDGTITLLQNQTFTAAGKARGDLEKEIRKKYVPAIFQNMTVSVGKTENTQFYYVGGEVKLPGRQVYISQLTVLRAIQSAGDFTDFANKKKVRLTRPNGTSGIINCIKARKDPKLDLPVYPGDTIFVPRRSIF